MQGACAPCIVPMAQIWLFWEPSLLRHRYFFAQSRLTRTHYKENSVQKLMLTVDRISTFVGQICAWGIAALTALICWEVFSRYVFSNPHAWVMDASNMLYGFVFMMAGAYTLAKNGHVRGDVLYGFFEPRTQALFDLVLYIVFFIPGVFALCWAGWEFFTISYAQNERSSTVANGPFIYPFKLVIPIAGAFLLLQGLVEILRCIQCLKTGEWPSREHDVEEVDVDKLKQMVSHDAPGATK
jgi:TRAP-type mannitol/chloroaromatic compound transport system permease small subunit